MDTVQEIRQFNRFYTRLVGLLDEHLPESRLNLLEGRVMYELATGGKQTAADLTRTLDVDKAQLSRAIHALRQHKLLKAEIDPAHAKKKLLSLTQTGRVAFTELEQGTRFRMESILQPLNGAKRKTLVASMRGIQAAFDAREDKPTAVVLRPLIPGDMGWVIHRQAVLYAQEYGWDWTYEALIARILGEFAAAFDPAKEDGWAAERAGQILGSIFLMKGDEPDVAKLRLLYVEPAARGLGIGRRLVDTCITRARELGYRRLSLWTNDVLTAARRIYEATGFRLLQDNRHRSFGKDLVGQTWELDLQAPEHRPASPRANRRRRASQV
jgi:DNA-binding MarR family transcriptional regulator/GNAT superfamily N-acetyltransferase